MNLNDQIIVQERQYSNFNESEHITGMSTVKQLFINLCLLYVARIK